MEESKKKLLALYSSDLKVEQANLLMPKEKFFSLKFVVKEALPPVNSNNSPKLDWMKITDSSK